MGHGKKFRNKVKPISGKKPSRTEHPPETDFSQTDVLIAPGQPSRVGTYGSKPNTAKNGNTGRRDNSAAPKASGFDGEHVSGNTENTAADIKVTQQSIPGNRDRPAAGSDENRDSWPVPSGQPPMFNGLHNTLFSGGTFIQNIVNERIRPGFELLQKRVATSAFHNSAQRVDPPRCHPNTRVAIQKRIYDWILLELLIRQTWIMWMHGAAGAGKSAIIQSIAELCEKAQIPLASFFFFRADPTRNSMTPFIATLVYQLIQKIPQARDEIFMIIENNPLVFDESLESQLEKLIIQPLLRVWKYFKYFVVMIDGLDECIERAHQSELIKLLGTVSRSKTIPVVFLVTSRREPQIEAAFVPKQVSDLVLTLPLDNSDVEQTSDDIRRFLTDKFQDIKETHLRRHLLPTNWPPAAMVQEIVTKSSGQFIYASVVINYVSSPRGNPAHLLDIIRGIRLRDPSSQNPFAHLDALYQYIFSQVEALDKVLDILAYILITKDTSWTGIECAFLLEDSGGLDVCFADLTAIITSHSYDWKLSRVEFLHASLPDFLRDNSRSERYHIDVEEYSQKLLCMFLDRVPPVLDPFSSAKELWKVSFQEIFRLHGIKSLLASGAKPSDQLQQSFMNFSIKFYEGKFRPKASMVGAAIEILKYLKQLNFNDQGQVYHHVLDMYAVQFVKHWSLLENIEERNKVENTPDLMARISQIRQAEL